MRTKRHQLIGARVQLESRPGGTKERDCRHAGTVSRGIPEMDIMITSIESDLA
jgi:hypothetical protein